MTTHQLERADLSIILQVYRYNAAIPGAPFLPAPSRWKRANKLAQSGLLKKAGGEFLGGGWVEAGAYFVTQAGIDAYNAALTSPKQRQS